MRPSKQILIIGRNAALSADLKGMLWPAGIEVKMVDGPEFGLLNIERLRRNLEALAPDLIISLVGSAAAEHAERDRTLTQARSHWAVGDLAEVAGSRDIPLLHLSSDQVFAGQVFSGDRNTRYLETDPADAVSVFGQSQAAGEAEIRAHCRRHVILRTGWLFGVHGHNMLRTMLSLARRGGRVHVPHDHISGPTPVRELCAALRQLALRLLETAPESVFAGHTLHFCATPAATLYEFAHAALGHAAAYQVAPDLVPITPGRFGVIGALARRTELDCRNAIAFGLQQPDWHAALASCVEEICQSENIITEEDIAAVAGRAAETALPYRGVIAETKRRGGLPYGVTEDRRRAV